MSRLLVFQHVAAEPLGTLDRLIRARGHRIRFHNFQRNPDAVPDVDRYRGLVVLGGPMNVEDREQRRHLLIELKAIERMLALDRPVLGICLGAQLLAHVLGAQVPKMDRPEIGWHLLRTTADGRSDPVLGVLGDATPVFQWHGFRFELPAGATHLMRGDNCEYQAFRYGERAYGFQFHLEMDTALIERWLASPLYRVQLADATQGVDAIRAQTAHHIAGMQQQADEVFSRFLDLIGRPQRRLILPSREWM